jgi:hypothetical protein
MKSLIVFLVVMIIATAMARPQFGFYPGENIIEVKDQV